MGLPECWFWESTPRKVIAIIDQKKEIETAMQKNLAVYIASYVWGKDPEEKKENSVVLGRDAPIDEHLLRGLL